MDDLETAVPLNAALEAAGYSTAMFSSLDDARGAVRRENPDLVILTGAVHEPHAVQLAALARDAEISTLALLEPTDSERAERVERLGVTETMMKPARADEIIETARRLIERRRLQERTGIIGESAAIQEVLVKIEQMAPVSSTVLVQGESGTGKELVAKALHDLSPRRGKPFITVNCAALPETLLESELFGHEKGSFTGATERRLGRFELADTGTIFLDEIGEIHLGHPGQAAAGAGEPDLLPGGRRPADQGGRPRRRGHQPAAPRCGRPGRVPRRPLLPAQRPQHLPGARCGSGGRTSPSWCAASSASSPGPTTAPSAASPRRRCSGW